MTYKISGNCNRCGSPIYVPAVWHGVQPPPNYHSCNCFLQNKLYTDTGTNPNPFIPYTPKDLPVPMQPTVYPTKNTQEAVEKLWEEFEDNDVTQTIPTGERLLRRLRKLEETVSDLQEKIESLEKDNEKLKSIKKILKD